MMNTTKRVATCSQADGIDLIEAGAAEEAQGCRDVSLRCWNSESTTSCGVDSAGSERDLSAAAVAHALIALT